LLVAVSQRPLSSHKKAGMFVGMVRNRPLKKRV
jgi:hypothetical protein